MMPGGHMMHAMPGGMQGGHMMGMTHANDVRYDAYLANDRTLDDPEIVQVDKGGRVRLRIINGGTATAFFMSTPGLTSSCNAVDGSACEPVTAQSYPLAQGQRIDLLVEIPQSGGAFPLLAQVEAARFVTGIVLATPGAAVTKLAASADQDQTLQRCLGLLPSRWTARFAPEPNALQSGAVWSALGQDHVRWL